MVKRWWWWGWGGGVDRSCRATFSHCFILLSWLLLTTGRGKGEGRGELGGEGGREYKLHGYLFSLPGGSLQHVVLVLFELVDLLLLLLKLLHLRLVLPLQQRSLHLQLQSKNHPSGDWRWLRDNWWCWFMTIYRVWIYIYPCCNSMLIALERPQSSNWLFLSLTVHAEYVCVAIIHRTLTCTIGSFIVCTDVHAFNCTWGVYGQGKRVCTERWLWEENPLPHQGIEPASVA